VAAIDAGVGCELGACPRDCHKQPWDPVCVLSAPGRRELSRCWARCDPKSAIVAGGPCAAAPAVVRAVRVDPHFGSY
jgi:hypothetical protein